jgi:hypothetical protein
MKYLHGSAGKKGVGEMGGGVNSAHPHPFLQQASGQIFKDDVYGFPSTSYICFLHGYRKIRALPGATQRRDQRILPHDYAYLPRPNPG